MILHFHKHGDHVGEAKLFLSRSLVLPERVQLARSDLVALDCVRLGEIGQYVADDILRDLIARGLSGLRCRGQGRLAFETK